MNPNNITYYPNWFLRVIQDKYSINFNQEYKQFIKENPGADGLMMNEEIEGIIINYCHKMQMQVYYVKGKSRKMEFVMVRQILMNYISFKYPLTLKQVGSFFNNRDHSTVIHARECIENYEATKNKMYLGYKTFFDELLNEKM